MIGLGIPLNVGVDEGVRAAEQYDAMAADYAADGAANVWNALCERPAMQALIGDVSGLRVLDAGCGAGELTVWLAAAARSVIGLDVSAAMLDLAGRRLAGRANVTLRRADLSGPLDLPEVDLVVASLVMHTCGTGSRSSPGSGGRWPRVLSTHHPASDGPRFSPDDYFARVRVTDE